MSARLLAGAAAALCAVSGADEVVLESTSAATRRDWHGESPRSAGPRGPAIHVAPGPNETVDDFTKTVAGVTEALGLNSGKVRVARSDPQGDALDVSFVVRTGGPASRSDTRIVINDATVRQDASTAQAVAARMATYVGMFLDSPAHFPLGRLRSLSHMDRSRLLRLSKGAIANIDHRDLASLFESRVLKHPDTLAVVCGETSLTYAVLNDRANRLARHLIAVGAGPEGIVSIVLPRSVDAIVAVLAVVKAGAAYLPIDPEYPCERIEFMLHDALPVCVVTTSDVEACLPDGLPRVDLDRPSVCRDINSQSVANIADAERRSPLLLDNAAYVIYTSGSTGRPKGVVIQHSGIAGLAETHAVPAGSRVLQFAPLSFDASVADLCTALPCGATLVIPDEVQRVPGRPLADFAHRHQITHLTLPPSALRNMPAKSLPQGAVVIAAGESITPDVVARWAGWVEIRNVYGQTETTVAATMSEPLDSLGALDAGRPLWNTRIYVLDSALRPVPEGVVGEIYVAGDGVGRGYLNRPELTAERYVADPFYGDGTRMYRSGDLGTWLPNGTLEVVGRVDAQVKVNGFRIEPAEIEAALMACPGVADAAVVAATNHRLGTEDKLPPSRLAAYIVSEDQGTAVAVSEIRDQLARTLPRHMLPTSFQLVAELPLTHNGKLDEARLPEYPDRSGPRRLVRSDAELAMCECFAAVLGVPGGISPDEDFFLLGGDSVKALHVVGQAREAGWVVTPQDVFICPRPADLAAVAKPITEDTGNLAPRRDPEP